MIVEEGHEQFEVLLAIYKADPQKGYIVGPDGSHYRVIKPSDDIIKFKAMGGIDNTYGSLSGGLGNG